MHSQEHLILSAPVDISGSGMACTVPSTSPVSEPTRQARPGVSDRKSDFDGPRHVVWEMAPGYNDVASDTPADAMLTTAEALALVDELAANGVQSLVLVGEPLARADWRALVGRAVQRGLAVEVESSGARITEHTAAALATLGVSVMVTIDSHLAEEHDALRVASGRHHGHQAGWHDRAVAAVRLLVASGVPVVVGFTATRRNWWDAAEVAALACALRAATVRFVEYAAGPCGNADLVLRPDERTAARTTWRELARHYSGHIQVSWRTIDSSGEPEAGPGPGPAHDCQGMSHTERQDDSRACSLIPLIRPDGTLTPGVRTATCIGSFRRRSLREIWTRSPLVAWLLDRRRNAAATTRESPASARTARRRRMVE